MSTAVARAAVQLHQLGTREKRRVRMISPQWRSG